MKNMFNKYVCHAKDVLWLLCKTYLIMIFTMQNMFHITVYHTEHVSFMFMMKNMFHEKGFHAKHVL